VITVAKKTDEKEEVKSITIKYIGDTPDAHVFGLGEMSKFSPDGYTFEGEQMELAKNLVKTNKNFEEVKA
jgi:hypothetical protein